VKHVIASRSLARYCEKDLRLVIARLRRSNPGFLARDKLRKSLFEIAKFVLSLVLRLLQDFVLRNDIRGNFAFKLHFSELSIGLLASMAFFLQISSLPLLGQAADKELILATTTSTENSGLLDVLLPPFEEKYQVKVKVIALGTGAAIRIAKDGNADLILVHARSLEDEFMAEGYGTKRYQVMHNDFVIVGPAEDMAQIEGKKDVVAALKKIALSQAEFVSRGDNSGTHVKEMSLWKMAEIKPQASWYIESGSGMTFTLRIANEKRAYTLSDRGTYLNIKKELDLVVLCQGDKLLFNSYGIIPVSPQKYPWIKYDLAMKLVEYITGKEGQEIIGQYGVVEFGEPLFIPDAQEES